MEVLKKNYRFVNRNPQKIMKLERLGSFFPHRLSFMRIFIRNLTRQKIDFKTNIVNLDDNGFGYIILSVSLNSNIYSLIAFSNKISKKERTDRVIANKWDASFCLFRGIPNSKEINELSTKVTKQEGSRYNKNILTLSRANKSIRLFDHVVDCLSNGLQPSIEHITKIGYLMRTTAVYGNGKFGIADRDSVLENNFFLPPFQIEMLTVWLIREYTFLLVEYVAKQKNKNKFIKLDKNIKKYLGIGNATGLGMAPFLINHPNLLHNWIKCKEQALSRCLQVKKLNTFQITKFKNLINRALEHCKQWYVEDEIQSKKIKKLIIELDEFKKQFDISQNYIFPHRRAILYTNSKSLEMQELMISIIIEIHSELVDELELQLSNEKKLKIFPEMSLSKLRRLIYENYRFAIDLDIAKKNTQQNFWYTSAEKLEPRLGNRFLDEGSNLEMPLNNLLYIKDLISKLDKEKQDISVAEFLIKYPNQRYIIRRVQNTNQYPYSEIYDNLVSADCRPIDLLRCKLSFFGASKFDPKSDKWTRITLFQGAPTAELLYSEDAEDWLFPVIPT